NLLGLPHQLGPAGPVVAASGLLVGEVADDPPAQLRHLRLALPTLRGEGERRVLLVLGREAPVPGEPAHQSPFRRRWVASRSKTAPACSRRSCASSAEPGCVYSIDISGRSSSVGESLRRIGSGRLRARDDLPSA